MHHPIAIAVLQDPELTRSLRHILPEMAIVRSATQRELMASARKGQIRMAVMRLNRRTSRRFLNQFVAVSRAKEILTLFLPNCVTSARLVGSAAFEPTVGFAWSSGEIRLIARLLLKRSTALVSDPFAGLACLPQLENDPTLKAVAISLRDSVSGRLNGRSICHFFGFSQGALAAYLGIGPSALNQHPASQRHQPALSIFEKIAQISDQLPNGLYFPDWMNSPNASFAGANPLDLVLRGAGNLVLKELERLAAHGPDHDEMGLLKAPAPQWAPAKVG